MASAQTRRAEERSRAKSREVVLVEDNSGRSARRGASGSASRTSEIILRIHRVNGNNAELLSERSYLPSTRGGDSSPFALAVQLLDQIPLQPRAFVVAGASYGCCRVFLDDLLERSLNFVVEIRPSTPVRLVKRVDSPSLESAAKASALLSCAVWQRVDVEVPTSKRLIPYSIASLGLVRIAPCRAGRLFAAQTGGINGVHQGTIFGIASDPKTPLAQLLRAVCWSRWIRPVVRREERRRASSASNKVNGVAAANPSSLQFRANITLARKQDRTLPTNAEGLVEQSPPRGMVFSSTERIRNVVELFAGAGGMGLGFLIARGLDLQYNLVASAELNPIFVQSLRRNHLYLAENMQGHGKHVPEKVTPLDLRSRKAFEAVASEARVSGGVDVLIGGPPCQGFSNANRNSWHRENPHNRLVEVFLQYVIKLRPRVFLMENVQGILWTVKNGRGGSKPTVVGDLAKRLEAAGYVVFPKLLDAVWYGVPQYRSRFFLLGIDRCFGVGEDDYGHWGPYPLPTHGPGYERPYVTVEEAIGDLPIIGNGSHEEILAYEPKARPSSFLQLMRGHAEPKVVYDHVTSRHAEYVLERYRQIPEGGNWQDILHTLTNYSEVERTHRA